MITPNGDNLGFKEDTDVGFTPTGATPANPPALNDQHDEHWTNLYAGLDGLDKRVDGPTAQALQNLNKTTDNPKEAQARVVNQSYYGAAYPNLPVGAWDSAKAVIAAQHFGKQGGVTDAQLYDLTARRREQTAIFRKEEWQNGTPYERFNMLLSHFVEHSDAALNPAPGEKGIMEPFKALPTAEEFVDEKLGEKEIPDMPDMGIQNPALVAGVWNSVVKPVVEGVESPLGVVTLGAGGLLTGAAKAGVAGAKPALVAMQSLFAGWMAKQTVENAPQTYRILNDPNSTTQQKVEAVGSTALPAMMALTGAVSAVNEVRPDLLAKLTGHPADVSETLKREAATAPIAEAEHLNAAAREIDKVAPPPKMNEAQQAWDEVKKVFSPASRGPEAGVAAGALREHGADLAQRTDRAARALESSSKQLMKLSPEERWNVVDRIENGQTQENPQMQAFADATRAILDTKRDEIQGLGTGKLEHFIEDYFPHIWKDPDAAADAFKKAQGRAPLEGGKSFLKQRTIPTTAEGIALGLEPASANPVELVLLKAREMDKFLLAQKWLAEMKEKNLVQLVRSGDIPPEGYEPINDKIATVYGPRQGGVSFDKFKDAGELTPQDVTVQGQRIMGKYYAPSGVATVANNYLSPGLRKYASFRAYLTAANSLNQFQLGLSAFHLGFTSVDASISKLALAIEYGTEGKIGKAAKATTEVAAAPITNLLQGNRVLKEWLAPGTQGEEFGKIVEAMRKAGGRAKMDSFYSTTISKRMVELFKEGGVGGNFGAAWRAPFAAMEQLSKPIMEYLVPRQKLGVFADLMRKELEKMPATATLDEQREVAGKVWDSVDNRMGQMVYDNIFWNKAAKDLAMASVRSVGWNLGTIRELGGGVKDAVKAAGDAAKGQMPEVTHRMAYAVALPVMTGLIGAMYQYMKTGKGPDELRDYFFPKTGEKDPQGRDVRLAMPTYMKDVYHYAHDPVHTVEGKVHPVISMTMQMLDNKDYFGRDIRNSDDPLVKQMADEAKYFAQNFMPIGIRNLQTSQAAGVSTAEKLANFVGVTRAPARVGETDAEQLAGQLAGDKFKSSKAPDAKVVADRQRVQTMLRNGTVQEKEQAMALLNGMVESGEITAAQKKNLVRGTDHTYLENAVSHLDAKEAMRVFRAANIAERNDIKEAVEKKIVHAHLPQEDRRELIEQLEKLSPKRDPSLSLR